MSVTRPPKEPRQVQLLDNFGISAVQKISVMDKTKLYNIWSKWKVLVIKIVIYCPTQLKV